MFKEHANPFTKGKTAPRLLQDFLQYDPSRLPSSGYNILADPPLQYEEGKQLPATMAHNACKHAWILKDKQSRLPEPHRELRPQMYIVSAYCMECRSHLELEMDLQRHQSNALLCPSEERPLHHFVHTERKSRTRQVPENVSESGNTDELVDIQRFQCSFLRCSAKLTVQIGPPRLTPKWVNLLSDPVTIRIRAEKAVAENLERIEGHPIPLPINVLTSLYQYIDNALTKEDVRTIQGNNKKFLLSLGEPCAEILQFLGFKRQVSC